MKNTSLAKTASLLLASASLLTVALTSCTPAEKPTEADKSVSASATAAPEASNAEKAATTVLNYSNGVKNNDSKLLCDSLDPRLINLTVQSFTSKTDTNPPNCEQVFSTILSNESQEKPQVVEGLNSSELAAKATEVSPTLYSFPGSIISKDDASTIFVADIDGNWKLTFDPADEDSVKQIEESMKAESSTPTPSSSAPASAPAQ